MEDGLGRWANFHWDASDVGPDGQSLAGNGIRSITLYDGSIIEYNIQTESVAPLMALIDTFTVLTEENRDYLRARYRSNPGFSWTKLGTMRRLRNGQTVASEGYRYLNPGNVYQATGALPLTGVTDANGVNYLSVTYNAGWRALSTEHPGGADRVEVSRDHSEAGYLNATVTNTLGRKSTYRYNDQPYGPRNLLSISGDAALGCEPDAVSYSEHTRQGVRRKVDREGRITKYTYNEYGKITSMVEAFGTPEEVTTETDWHSQHRHLPTEIRRPGETISYAYEDGRLVSVTQTDTLDLSTPERITTFTYGSHPFLPDEIDGPLPGPSDTVHYSYDGERLLSVTDPLGNTTHFSKHTSYGLPRSSVDPNGVETRYTYDAQNRLVQIAVDPHGLSAITRFGWDPLGQLLLVEEPNGARLNFTYNHARRIARVRNAEGDAIHYTYDLMGGVTSTVLSDGTNDTFIQTQARDALSRVMATMDVGGASRFRYDREGNNVSVIDRNGGLWRHAVDSLNRIIQTVDPDGEVTRFGLAAQNGPRDALMSVTDARRAVTTYERNGFGEVIAEESAEAGRTEYRRDERGLVTQRIDARGQVVNFEYDFSGRLVSESYQGFPESDVTYVYDDGTYGIGQLTSVKEAFGTTYYNYNALGHLVEEARELAGILYSTYYEFDLSGHVVSTTYPSGRKVLSQRDAASRIVSLTFVDDATEQITEIASNITYAPFGPLTGARSGDGTEMTVSYDTAYRATRLSRIGNSGAIFDVTFSYDPNGNITGMEDLVRPERSQQFGYDPLDRLTSGYGAYGQLRYGYGPTGDRLSRDWTDADGAAVLNETFDYTAHRLSEIRRDGELWRSLTYTEAGQLETDTQDGVLIRIRNDARGRLAEVRDADGSLRGSYVHDIHELRVSKTLEDGTVIHFHYDMDGRLIAETDGATGETIREHVWLGLMPVATFGDLPQDPDGCERTLLEETEALIALRTDQWAAAAAQLTSITASIARYEETRTIVAARLQGFRDALAAVPEGDSPDLVSRREDLAALIARDEARLADLDSHIAYLETREADLAAHVDTLDAAITRLTARADRLRADCAASGDMATGVVYLHADHLGRPVFGTDAEGTVVWRGGITTPFGVSVTGASALSAPGATPLRFPGQYADAETARGGAAGSGDGGAATLWHYNHHRTYDPALGRYLQSDPIGLQGGINRYAYVGGNPVGWVDPKGLDGELSIFAKDGEGGFGHAFIQFCPTLPDPDGRTQCETQGMWPQDDTHLNPFDNANNLEK